MAMRIALGSLLALLTLSTGCGGDDDDGDAAEASFEKGPMEILLVNDDGWDSEGIQSLKRKLREAGHHVILVGPSINGSGSAAALTIGEVPLVEEGEDEYSLAASPATCAFAGISLFEGGPDLVVSGTNDNINTGGLTVGSGTVGSMATGLYHGIPAIATSSYDITLRALDEEAYVAHYEAVADFLVRTIDLLADNHDAITDGNKLLPEGIGLTINYPPELPENIRGIRVAVQGRPQMFHTSVNTFGIFGNDVKDTDPLADTALYVDDYITVVPIKIDYTAAQLDAFRAVLEQEGGESTEPLDILLTSEEQWDATGPQTLKQTLMDAGHNVILLAPNESTIGGASRTPLSRPCRIEMRSDNEYSTTAPPSICVETGSGRFDMTPDLVISGINSRLQLGANLLYSGALGPVLRGVASLEIPGIAINAPVPEGTDEAEHYQEVADYTLGLVSRLQTRDELPGDIADMPGLLPPEIALNVNYPALAMGDLEGVKVSRQSGGAESSFFFVGDGKLVNGFGPAIDRDNGEGTDVGDVEAGYISLLPMRSNWTAPDDVWKKIEAVFDGFVMDQDVPVIDASMDTEPDPELDSGADVDAGI